MRLKSSGRTVSAGKILIATGGTPSFGEDIPGLEHAITSNEAFDLKELPERIAIYGAGYIALEFAGIFAGLGSETTLVFRGDKMLRGFDEDLRDGITAAYAKRGIRLVPERTFVGIDKTDDGLVGRLDDGSTIEADQIMFAIGRAPNTAGLGLEAAGVERGWNGHVVVDPVLALLGRDDLRRRRRDRPPGAYPRRHSRGTRLCRHRVRQQAVVRRAHDGADGGVLHAGDRHDRAAAAPGGRALRQARDLQGLRSGR